MFLNYLKLTIRNSRRKWGYALLNLIGLSTGCACFILIGLFVREEITFDRFHSRGSHIFQMKIAIPKAGMTIPPPNALAVSLESQFPQVQAASPLGFSQQVVIKHNNNLIVEDAFLRVNPSFFSIFDFPLQYGDLDKVLDAPGKLVISSEIAEKYFPGVNPVGNSFRFEKDSINYMISGVLKSVPANSSIRPNFLANFSNKDKGSWKARNYIYVLFKNSKPDQDQFKANVIRLLEENGQVGHEPSMEAFEDLYLAGKTMGVKGDRKTVNTMMAVALLILLLACVNYINLSTARMSTRLNEIGVRRVLGAEKREIRLQFLTETLLLVVLAILLSAGLVEGGLLLMNDLISRPIALDYWSDPFILPFFILLIPSITLFAGLYPSIMLSNFKPARVLKHTENRSNSLLRKLLIGFQFTITLTLIVATLVMKEQVAYFLSFDSGMDKEAVLVLDDADFINDDYKSFKNELLAIPGVIDVTGGPSTSATGYGSVYSDHFEDGVINMPRMDVDHNYLEVLGIDFVQGRNFMPESTADYSGAVIINESAAKAFNFEEPIGAKISFYDYERGQDTERTIIGVTRDFIYDARYEIPNVIVVPYDEPFRVSLKVNTTGVSEVITRVEEKWKTFSTTDPFGYEFLDDKIQALYTKEKNYSQLFSAFTLLAILIAILGLMGLSTFTAQLRLKEIGIRKVLGASINSILKLLLKGYLGLVLLALIIATPMSFLFLKSWLNDFAHQIDISWTHYLFGLMAIVVILIIAVFSQSIKAALCNPAQILKDE